MVNNMKILKKEKSKYAWIIWGVLVSLALSLFFSSFYGRFREGAERNQYSPLEQPQNMEWLYRSSYLLYRDLYNVQNKSYSNYADIYLESPTDSEEASAYVNTLLTGQERGLASLNSVYDYVVKDNKTDKYVTNMSEADLEKMDESAYFLLRFTFDSAGHVTVDDVIHKSDATDIRKLANEVMRENYLRSASVDFIAEPFEEGKVTLKAPVDCTVTYAIPNDSYYAGNATYSLEQYNYWDDNTEYNVDFYCADEFPFSYSKYAYVNAGAGSTLMFLFLVAALLGLFLPVLGDKNPWNEVRVCSLPFEILFCIGITIFACLGNVTIDMVASVASGNAVTRLTDSGFPWMIASWFTGIMNILVLTVFLFSAWYFGICARAIPEKGVIGYIKERSLIYRFFPFMKRKIVGVYKAASHMDLTKDSQKTILKIILVNAGILIVISCLWFGGMALTVAYSIALYFILKKYVSDLQKRYRILLQATNEIAEGNLNVTIEEDLGVFEPFKPQVIKIQNGFKKAVDEEVKSQRMKAELITNVSHDLKTPLTAIITYVNLLQDENLTKEQQKEYLDVLERKSLRLKSLIEDLFEMSKANSQTITLNRANVDIISLIKQVVFELKDKFEAADLDVRMTSPEEKLLLFLDSQKTYRIYENLFNNIAKYAMKGTRVYVNVQQAEDKITITLKNISAQELTVASEELTERFVRGDVSRNTEGSGLGLAIAKSFTELQGGALLLEIDGDLFKVTTEWSLPY